MTPAALIVRYLYSIGFREVRAFGEVYYLRGYESYSLKYLKCFCSLEEFSSVSSVKN